MISRYRFSIGAVFSLLVLATTVPLALFAAALIGASWRQQVVMIDRQNIEVARAISVAVDQEVERTIGALTLLGSFIPADGGDQHAFEDICRRIAPEQQWESVRLVSPSSGAAEEDWVRGAVANRVPVVSSVRKLPERATWMVSVGVPVFRGGAVKHVLVAHMQARGFGGILRRQQTPADGVVTLFDDTPAIVTRTMNEETLVGLPPTPEFLARSRGALEGAWRSTTREGVLSYAAWSRSSLTGWTVGLSVPAAAIEAPIRRSYYALTAAGVAISAGGLFCALLLRRRLVAAQRAVATTARTLARGEPISAPESSIAELQDLSAALREAAAILRMRQQERDDAEGKTY